MTSSSHFEIIRAPIITEKATALTEFNKVVFEVSSCATKTSIKKAVKAIFNVDALAVNIINVQGKKKNFKGRKGQRSDFKKAIVTLAKGQTIDYTAGV